MMARITGGLVSYLRRVNTGNYEHKEFRADISWSAEEEGGAEEMIERAADMAVGVVHQRLGLASGEAMPVQVVETGFGVGPGMAAVAEQRAENEEKIKRHRATKAEMEHRAQVKADGDAAKARLQAPPEQIVDPFVDDAPLSSAPAATSGSAAGGQDADPLLGEVSDELTALPPDISNDDLIRAAEKKKAELKDALAIRRLIGAYAVQLSMIPQSRRGEFLAELAALK